jgi:hypothetical protein
VFRTIRDPAPPVDSGIHTSTVAGGAPLPESVTSDPSQRRALFNFRD